MTLTTITTLASCAAAGVVAWSFGGREGSGVLLGFLAGASVAGLGIAIERRIARARPALLVHAILAGFLLKAFTMLGLTLAVRYVPQLHDVADAPAFLLAFAAAVLFILVPATVETVRLFAPARVAERLSLPLEEGRAL